MSLQGREGTGRIHSPLPRQFSALLLEHILSLNPPIRPSASPLTEALAEGPANNAQAADSLLGTVSTMSGGGDV